MEKLRMRVQEPVRVRRPQDKVSREVRITEVDALECSRMQPRATFSNLPQTMRVSNPGLRTPETSGRHSRRASEALRNSSTERSPAVGDPYRIESSLGWTIFKLKTRTDEIDGP